MAFSSDYDQSTVHCPYWKKIDPAYEVKPKLPDNPLCPVCNREATSRCGACYRVAYCSNSHQRSHWKKVHKSQCCPFKIVQGDPATPVGRYLVAARDIEPGEVVIEEKPVTAGPRQFTTPVCLGCYREVDGPTVCEGCRWPSCGDPACSGKVDSIHKVSGECAVLSRCQVKPRTAQGDLGGPPLPDNPIYECITPLRCLLVKGLNPENWGVMLRMEQHTEQRRQDPFFKVNQTNTVRFLQQHVFGTDSDGFTDDEINAVVNVLDINAFEIRGNDFSIRGVYPLTAMMNSVCTPNTQNCIDLDFTCRVKAATPIPKGAEITTTYTLGMAGTLYRRRHLKESKYFECTCQRCADPTELGTNFSTLICRSSDDCRDRLDGYVISSDPLKSDANWVCQKCGATLTSDEVEGLVDALEKEASGLPLDKQAFEDTLARFSQVLHPNHHIMVDLEFTLVQLYGRDRASVPAAAGPGRATLVEQEAPRKLELCEKVLGILAILMPGQFRLRGMFLSELYGFRLFDAKRRFEDGLLDGVAFLRALQEARAILEEALLILSHEPANTVEGARCQTVRELLAQNEKLIGKMGHQAVLGGPDEGVPSTDLANGKDNEVDDDQQQEQQEMRPVQANGSKNHQQQKNNRKNRKKSKGRR